MAPTTHWAEAYIGQPYIHGEADCARLVCRVRDEVFGHTITDADIERASSAYGRAAQIGDGITDHCTRTDTPTEGDVVLMRCRHRPSHVGVYCRVGGEPAVLHAIATAKQVVLHRLRDLHRVRLEIEGFYSWK